MKNLPLSQHIRKHNVLIICRVKNALIVKDGNRKFYVRKSPNRNNEYLFLYFSLESRLVCLNTKFPKKRTYTNSNKSKVLLNYTFINKKWMHYAMNWEAYPSFEGLLAISELSQQRFAGVFAEIRNKQLKLHDMTSRHSPIVILEINIR